VNTYRVYLHGHSMTASYDGYVDVVAVDEDEAVATAKRRLTQRGGTFGDWSPSMFRATRVERRGDGEVK
jgi:hypothetical protein